MAVECAILFLIIGLNFDKFIFSELYILSVWKSQIFI